MAFGFGIALVITGIAISVTITQHTIFNLGLFFGLVFMASAASAIPACRLWQKITGWEGMVWNGLLHVVVLSALLSGVILSVNYFCASDGNFARERVIVENKYRKTEYQSRRISRRVYTRGNPYYVYEVELRFLKPEFAARNKTVRIPKKQYDALRLGDTATVSLGRGALSMPVFNDRTLNPLHPRKKTRHHNNYRRRHIN